MVITQQAAQSLAALNRPVAAGVCTAREQQDIALPLVIPFGMNFLTMRRPFLAQKMMSQLGSLFLIS
jgi:hypothetical protein